MATDTSTSVPLLRVFIRSRNRTFFEGSALAVTSNNEKGIFDVLPFHANFISLIKDYLEVSLPNGEKQRIDIDKGLLRVADNTVDVYLEIQKE